MLIDFHTHIFPDKIAAHSVEILLAGIRREQGDAYCDSNTLIYRPATLDGLLELMERAGVDRSICLPIATKPSQTESINRYAESVCSEKVLSFGSLHPADPDWERVLCSLAERGCKGIKLHPQFQQMFIDSPEVIRIIRKCEALGMLVMIHAGSDIGLPPPVYATPERIAHAMTETSGSNLIAAHLGGWGMWNDVERYLVGTPVLLDTAFIWKFISREQCRRIIRTHGAEKILFGSDSPWEDPAATLAFLQSLDLTEAEMAQITHRNALRILGETESA